MEKGDRRRGEERNKRRGYVEREERSKRGLESVVDVIIDRLV